MVEKRVLDTGMSQKDVKKLQKALLSDLDIILSEKARVADQLRDCDKLLKPYVAEVKSYSGGGEMAFATLEKAEAKYREYMGKKKFRNGLNYGVLLYKWVVKDGEIVKELLDCEELSRDFTLDAELKEQALEKGLMTSDGKFTKRKHD